MTVEIDSVWVKLAVSDGTRMRAYSAQPRAGDAAAGLMVFQEAFGVNAHIRDVTERFAREGYSALAPEIYHRNGDAFECDYSHFEPAMKQIQSLTDAGLEADIKACHEFLVTDSMTCGKLPAAVGYCLGGRVAFLANAVVPLAASVSFYGGGIAPGPRGPGLLDRAGALHGPLMMIWGGKDQHIPPEQGRAVAGALRDAGKTFIHSEFSDADHAFFCDMRPSYHAPSAKVAWAMTLEFLAAYRKGSDERTPA
ncbi:MAG: dienelactone hydrolase family protein [Terriglobia bacterium]